jgi:DNA-3-methyladenine glycosylase II
MAKYTRGFDLTAAQAHLTKRDRKLGAWIKRIGPIEPDGWHKPFETVDSLARSILYQQLSGKAAATIVGRVEVALASRRLNADALLSVDETILRGCGVSGNKVLALRDLATRASAGEVPSARRLTGMDDEAIIEALTAVRGIGRWTVEMLLMFRDAMPAPKVLAARGEAWGPYRTLAGLYLWRIVDSAKQAQAPVKRSQD